MLQEPTVFFVPSCVSRDVHRTESGLGLEERSMDLILLLFGLVQVAANTSWFQATEQALMTAIASGDKRVWDRVLDERCVYTSEEGEVLTKQELLKQLTGLPPGLSGRIKVEELTLQEYPTFAIVRFLASEEESVFGQLLKTKYRVTDTFRRDGSEWK